MGALTRGYDWSQTPLGPADRWPQSLRTIVGIVLRARLPMCLFWSSEFITFYNDPFRLGRRLLQPALGRHSPESWSGNWSDIQARIDDVLASGESSQQEDLVLPLLRDGRVEETVWTHSYSPVCDETGCVAGVLLTAVETTVAARTIRRLEESERLLRTFILQSPAAMAILRGPDYVVDIVNDCALRLWRRQREEVSGRPILEAMPELKGQGIQGLLDHVFHSGTPFKASELPVQIGPEGALETRYVNFTYETVYDADGRPDGIMAVGVDVTDQVRARHVSESSAQQVRSLIEGAPFPIALYVGEELRIRFANRAMTDVYGQGPDVVGRLLYGDVLPELASQPFPDQVRKAYATGVPHHAVNQRVDLEGPDGPRTFYFNYSFIPLLDAEEQVYGVLNTAADVTDLNLAKKELEQNETQLRSIIAGAPAAIGLFVGRDLIVSTPNQLFIDIVGKGPDIEGRPLREILPELLSDNEPFFQILDDVYTSGKPFQSLGTQVNLMQNGVMTHNYYNITFTPLFDANGEVYAILDVSVDVTEQITHRNKIEEEKERANLAVTVAGLSVFEVDLETNVVTSDRRFYELFGFDRPVSRADYVQAIHPDDRSVRDANNRQAVELGWFDYECRIVHPGKPLRWLRLKGKALRNEKGEAAKMLGVVQDITEQKEFASALSQQVQERTQALEAAQQALLHANKYLQYILDNFNTAFVSLEPIYGDNGTITDFRFRMSNVAYSAYTGLPPSAIEGRPVSELFPGYYSTEAFERYRTAFEHDTTDNWEQHYDQDGLNVYLQVGVSRNAGELWAHFIDITDLKNLQIELVRKVEELERSNQNLEEFAYAASHDLKEPIRKIHYFSDRLKLSLGDGISADQRLVLGRMDTAARRMGSLIDNLLSYSQVSLRARVTESVDLNRLLAVVLDDLDLQVEEKKATIERTSLPSVAGHARQLQQAFHNLIGNALKYSRADVPPVIRIDCVKLPGRDTGLHLSPVEQLREYYRITVSDNGIGFEQENAGRIFNIFTRLHTNAEYSGTGIGLSIVRKVIENHGGFIRANGEPGKGSSFEIFLPVVTVIN